MERRCGRPWLRAHGERTAVPHGDAHGALGCDIFGEQKLVKPYECFFSFQVMFIGLMLSLKHGFKLNITN